MQFYNKLTANQQFVLIIILIAAAFLYSVINSPSSSVSSDTIKTTCKRIISGPIYDITDNDKYSIYHCPQDTTFIARKDIMKD